MSIRKASAQNTKVDTTALLAKERVEAVIKPSSHHAYCFITADPAFGGEVISEALFSAWNISSKGNPDFFYYSKSAFNIEDAHVLRDWSSTNPVREKMKVCCIETHSLTEESQNALLKLFESTPTETFFFLVVPSKEIFLPTLYSRLVISTLDSQKGNEEISVKRFLSSSISERNRLLKGVINERDKGKAGFFLDQLEEELYQHERGFKASEEKPNGFDAFIHSLPRIKKMNFDQRSSVKSLMEHVIHFAPFIKEK